MILLKQNNQVSNDAYKFFLDLFTKKGYTTAGKKVVIDAESQILLKDLTAAGNWFMLKNSATAPTAALVSPLYVGDLRIKTFVQAFTSGTFDKYHGLAQVNNAGAALNFLVAGKKAIAAVEAGDPTDADYIENVFNDVVFSDAMFTYGVGAAPIGTIRCQIQFDGLKISLQ